MSFINYEAREINVKVVYYGPGLCGKTTNIQYVYNKTDPKVRGGLVSLATDTERSLSFDFLPQTLPEIGGFKIRFHLYTVPGPVFYDVSRRLILRGVDGVIFVADSQRERTEANSESLEDLTVNLESQGFDPVGVPLVLQYNKRDLPTAVPIEEMDEQLRSGPRPRFEAIAPKGVGVFDSLKALARLLVAALERQP